MFWLMYKHSWHLGPGDVGSRVKTVGKWISIDLNKF